MTKESEKIIERKLVESVKNCGGLCVKLLCDQLIGLPDRMCLFPGSKIVFVEVKTTGQKPRKIQACMHNRLKALGFRVEIIDNTESIKQLISEMK